MTHIFPVLVPPSGNWTQKCKGLIRVQDRSFYMKRFIIALANQCPQNCWIPKGEDHFVISQQFYFCKLT